jgi:hypothetical protein
MITSSTLLITQQGLVEAAVVASNISAYQLLSFNMETGQIYWTNIESVTDESVNSTITIEFVSGKSISCSYDQMLFVLTQGFMSAANIDSLDRIAALDKNEIVLRTIHNESAQTVYKFVTDGANKYFGNDILLVNIQ